MPQPLLASPVRPQPFTLPRSCKAIGMGRRLSLALMMAASAFMVTLLPALSATAQEQDGRAVMEKVRDQARIHENQRAEVDLVIRNAKGRERVRRFRLLYKVFPDRTKSLAKFFRPASVSGTAMLSESREEEGDTLQWIYLPALRAIRQLSTEEKNDSFMGSDFSNADIAGRQVDQDNHLIVREDERLIYIESIPKDQTDPYSKLELEILREIYVPSRIVFYDRQGKRLKTLENKKISRVKGMYTPVEAQMSNHQSQGISVLNKSNIDVETPISPLEVGFKGLRN